MILNYRAKVIRERGKDATFEIDAEDSLTLTALMKASINGHLEVSKIWSYRCTDCKTASEIRSKS